MQILLDGKKVADALTVKIKDEATALNSLGINPTLCILRVGENESDMAYERGASGRCEKAGICVKKILLDEDISKDDFYGILEEVNGDTSIHGILMFRPLPERLDNERARLSIIPKKDVDGCTDASLTGVFTGKSTGFAPCTAQAVLEILDYYNIDAEGKRVVIIGRSLVIGRPVAMMLMSRGATPTICHTKTKNIKSLTREADIIIACSGQMESIDSSYIINTDGFSLNGMHDKETLNPANNFDVSKKGTDKIIIDVGINWNEEKGKLCGDVVFEEVAPIVNAITPVPGGVGSVTSSVLALHVLEAAKNLSNIYLAGENPL